MERSIDSLERTVARADGASDVSVQHESVLHSTRPVGNKRNVKRRWLRWIGWGFIGVILLWGLLTIWVQTRGPALSWTVGVDDASLHAVIVFDPDPIYDLDAQVSRHFADGLAQAGFRSVVATAAATDTLTTLPDLVVVCANTYNWRPDRAIARFVEDRDDLSGKPVVAITLGSGSTAASQRVLEEALRAKGARLIGSRSFWLMRPNDESRMEEGNVDVALSMVGEWGKEVGLAFGPNGESAQ